jgi:2-keto-4-pentenoate hydratase/2-oxohepta-3-ene-1,7-dioic acid hydratase in catechol pathway
MHVARYEAEGRIVWGVARDGGSYARLPGTPFEGLEPGPQTDRPGRLLAPVDPPRVFGAGLNYVSHIAEGGDATPQIPMLFMKPPTAVIGPEEPIVLPLEDRETHFEGELAVVIGRRARRLSREDALSAVLGYTCANDVSERVIQKREMAMGCLVVGKGFDTFCPLGPVIATGLDPTALTLEARLNGERRQSIETSDLLFSVADLVSWLSQAVTLLPGDVIITGTPAGVGRIAPGDVVEIEIGGIGVLRNPVVAEER